MAGVRGAWSGVRLSALGGGCRHCRYAVNAESDPTSWLATSGQSAPRLRGNDSRQYTAKKQRTEAKARPEPKQEPKQEPKPKPEPEAEAEAEAT